LLPNAVPRRHGFYDRALESAQRRGETNRFVTFFGKLVEAYCLEVAQSVYTGERPVGAGRVHGEQRYGLHAGKRTSDVAIDLGTDLVLIEVVSARFATDVRVYGNPEVLSRALERMPCAPHEEQVAVTLFPLTVLCVSVSVHTAPSAQLSMPPSARFGAESLLLLTLLCVSVRVPALDVGFTVNVLSELGYEPNYYWHYGWPRRFAVTY